MKGIDRLALLALMAAAGCATTSPSDYLYFPGLASRVLAGDAQAFRQVLAQADVTPPGEQLEELAELSSRFVRIDPTEFLRGQAPSTSCFGVSFMGAGYVDDPVSSQRELTLRRTALESVRDPVLASARQRCLVELGGS